MSDGRPIPSDRVCLVLLSGIGDVVHGLAVANALRDDRPRRRIVWVAQPAPAEVLRAHPSVDEVVVFRRHDGLRGVRTLRRDLRRARGPGFDVALNLQLHFKGVVPALLSGAPVRLGLDRDRVRDAAWLFSNRRLPRRPWAHVQDVFLEFLEPLAVPRPETPEWRIAVTAEERAAQHDFFARLPGGRPVVALAVASAIPGKDWPAERCADLAEALERDFGCVVLLVGGPGARERAAADRILARTRGRSVGALADGVRRLIWLLEGSDLAISPDSGPLHIAHALGTPVVGLYGHTNPLRTGPYARFRDLVVDRYWDPGEEPTAAAASSREGRMERIRVEDVLEKVELAFRRHVGRRGILRGEEGR